MEHISCNKSAKMWLGITVGWSTGSVLTETVLDSEEAGSSPLIEVSLLGTAGYTRGGIEILTVPPAFTFMVEGDGVTGLLVVEVVLLHELSLLLGEIL